MANITYNLSNQFGVTLSNNVPIFFILRVKNYRKVNFDVLIKNFDCIVEYSGIFYMSLCTSLLNDIYLVYISMALCQTSFIQITSACVLIINKLNRN